jgi:hypothetical protein
LIISFTDKQLALVMQAAELVPVNDRDNFLRSISSRLVDLPYLLRDCDIEQAVAFVLETRGVVIGRNGLRCKQTTKELSL